MPTPCPIPTMRSTVIFILPMVFDSYYVLGSLVEYEQNVYLYSSYTLLSSILGMLVLVFV